MKRSGVTLIELMVASVLSIIVALSLSTAFSVVVRHQLNAGKPRQTFETISFMEDRVRGLLEKAIFTNSPNQTTYFRGDSVGGGAFSDRLIFTSLGERVRGDVIASAETDFAIRNTSFGPVGGVTENELSTTAVGDAQGKQGLFYRHQNPADTDIEKGGMESLLGPDIATIQYEFWDGTTWAPTWDTTTQIRLPDAVRVHYFLNSDPAVEHIFVVRLPNAIGEDALAAGGQTQ